MRTIPHLLGPVALAAASVLCCARTPIAAMELSPQGHGGHRRGAGPWAVGWRANALAAPCALSCRASVRDIGCTCGHVDSLYFSHLERGMRLGAADPVVPPKGGSTSP